ncbi:MAG: PmeII family type II restriction endonuclease [Thermoplasmataceae archaeon]
MSVQENYIRTIAREFTRRQLSNIKSIALDNLNINPLLVRSLNLKTPHEMLEFNIYATVSRSIVASMGYFVQDLLSITSDSVEEVRAGWDMVKHGDDGTNHWIPVKSDPNDMDKDQIVYWLSKIEDAEA